METLKSYKQFLSLKVRFGSIKNLLEMLISTAQYAKEWKGLPGQCATSSPKTRRNTLRLGT